MKILQVTNIVSHHQLPLARELCSLVGSENFRFAAMQEFTAERSENGWKSDYQEPWILHPSDNTQDAEEFESFWDHADVVLCGERLVERMQSRVNDRKLCFYMSERWWKPPVGKFRLLHPKFLAMALKFRALSKSEYFHFLPTGPFANEDIRWLAPMPGRTWSWGYFTEVLTSELRVAAKVSSSSLTVLWVGRMLDWKRVDLLIKSVAKVNKDGPLLHLRLVGDGPERQKLEKLAKDLLKSNEFSIQGFVPSTEVPSMMAKHDIYALTSNAYEGWGAVINEAMAAGCAVISSDKTGAGAAIIEHGRNGLLFKSGSLDDLTLCLNWLRDDQERIKLSQKAKSDANLIWNPSVVARRFVELCDEILVNGDFKGFSEGPLVKL